MKMKRNWIGDGVPSASFYPPMFCLFLQQVSVTNFASDFILFHPVQWRIHDFSEGGAPVPKLGLFSYFFAENCMKMKEFGP